MSIMKKAANIFLNVLLWILVLVVAFFAVVTFATRSDGSVSNLFGYTPMTVLTDSMSPTFRSNDLIIIKAESQKTYKVGDVVSYWTFINGVKSINTHRVVDVREADGITYFTTRGDNNSADDSLTISRGDIIGHFVVKVPFMGKILAVLSSSVGFFIILVIPLLLFFLFQLYKFIVLMMELRKQTVIEATKEAMAQAGGLIPGMDAIDGKQLTSEQIQAQLEQLQQLQAQLSQQSDVTQNKQPQPLEGTELEHNGGQSDDGEQPPQ